MIILFEGTRQDSATQIVALALRRSVTNGLVMIALDDDPALICNGGVYVFVSPSSSQAPLVAKARRMHAKILLLGALPLEITALCGLGAPGPLGEEWTQAAACAPAPVHSTAQSAALVQWNQHALAAASPFTMRPFLRYDFADEWNNLGYGRITRDGGPWSLAMACQATDASIVATARVPGVVANLPFVTLLEDETSSLLWWNRAVGPVDSAEWAVIETFLADWRHHDRPCVPVICEIPHGFDAAITMRLDCDEDIASARPLFELYRDRGLPFSLAVKTDQDDGDQHISLLKDVIAAGGSVLSHSVSHAPRWGGSDEACYAEARGSSDWLEARLPGLKVRHAGSPFHQNPAYVPNALGRAGLSGFIGGIIANDPEMLLAKGGVVPDCTNDVVSHSQQCMLHGDCILDDGDPLTINKQAFASARRAGSIFGYLDHPFSPRYDYGWGSEEHRLWHHIEFLEYFEKEMEGLATLWLNEDDVLEWIAAKMRLTLRQTADGFELVAGETTPTCGDLSFAVRWRGTRSSLSEFLDG